jgi:hypothetical protein
VGSKRVVSGIEYHFISLKIGFENLLLSSRGIGGVSCFQVVYHFEGNGAQ